jgi:hypothetical protein
LRRRDSPGARLIADWPAPEGRKMTQDERDYWRAYLVWMAQQCEANWALKTRARGAVSAAPAPDSVRTARAARAAGEV